MGLILVKTQQAGLQRMPPSGLVITGGAAEMPGLQELATRFLGCPVRIGIPSGIPALSQEFEKPSFSTSLGLLKWGIKNHSEKVVRYNTENGMWTNKAFKLLKRAVEAR